MTNTLEEIFCLALLLLIPAWKIFKKAGLNQYYCLLVLIPYLGVFIAALILAITKWKQPTPKGDAQ